MQKDINKPIVIAETGYSTFCEGDTQANVIGSQVKLSLSSQLAGIIIFEWCDEWGKIGHPERQDNHIEEHWGIVNGYRRPKEGYEVLNALFSPN